MIAVDSSVLINFFRGLSTPHVDRLAEALTGDGVALPDLVLVETLQGCRDERDAQRVHKRLSTLMPVFTCNPTIAVEAARNYRLLRAKGITVRSTIDTLIATRCIVDDLPLLFSDLDFVPFVEHLGLRDAMSKAF